MNDLPSKIIGAIGKNNTVTQTIHLQPGQPAPYMLPQEIGDFTGRVDYIDQIEAILNQGNIAAIAGIPGVGKSALAIRVAYRLKERYPDAQLYINLYGQTPEVALEPKAVLIRFLTALTGRDESQLPIDLDGLVGQYRSTLATKRAVVILDNARDEAQIRDLLSSSPNCAVVVTSRSRLTGLPGAGSIDLEPMAVGIDRELGEAELLFQAILQDGQRVEAELAAAREIVRLCGGLPIAIRITAATLKQQIWARKPLQAYAQELATESTRLSKLENENVEAAIPGQGSVRASFNLSYQALTEEEQQLFRYAGGLPGVNFGLEILAAVMEREKSQIEAGLGRLLEAQVLELRGDSRFGWHDLMRLFAKAQLTESEGAIVEGRGLSWYCKWARIWNNGLDPVCCRQLAQQLAAEPEDSAEELERGLLIFALTWFVAEQENWVDIVKDLTQLPRPDDAIALAINLVRFFDLHSIWGDWEKTHEMVKDCAQQAGNLLGATITTANLGNVYKKQGKWDESISCYQECLKIFRHTESRYDEIQALNNLGNVYQSQGEWAKSISLHQECLEISRQLGYRDKEAEALNNLGNDVYQSQGEWAESISLHQQSLEIKYQLGDHHGAAQSLNNLGLVYYSQGDLDKAFFYYNLSLEIKLQLGDQHGAASSLNNLGLVCEVQNKWEEAMDFHQQSLEIKHQLGDSHGAGISLANLGLIHCRCNQAEQALKFWKDALTYLHSNSPEFKTVQQWLENPPKD